MGLFGTGQITDDEMRAIDEAVKADPWAFIEGIASRRERPLSDLIDWMLARHADHESAREEAS